MWLLVNTLLFTTEVVLGGRGAAQRLLRQHVGPSTWHRVHQDRTCPSQVRSSEADSRRMDRMASPERRRLPLAVDGSGLERASHHVHNTKTRHTPTRCTHHTPHHLLVYMYSLSERLNKLSSSSSIMILVREEGSSRETW